MSAKLSIGHAVKTDEFVMMEGALFCRKIDELLFTFEQIGDTESARN